MPPARFTVAPADTLRPGDMVCIDTRYGWLRKARPEDRDQFAVPADAWQDDNQLCIPEISAKSVPVLH